MSDLRSPNDMDRQRELEAKELAGTLSLKERDQLATYREMAHYAATALGDR